MTKKQMIGETAALAVTCILIIYMLVAYQHSNQQPHLLVGYGCEGSNGQPMYYTEEPDFPPCSLIERSSWRNSVAVESAR